MTQEEKKEYWRKYEQSPKGKETRRKYWQSPKGKKVLRIYRESLKGRKARRKYERIPKVKEIYKKYRQSSKGKERNKRYSQSLKGKESKARRRQFGFVPLNEWFEGSEGHHIDEKRVIYIPKKIHRSVWHSMTSGVGMDKINKLAFEYLQMELSGC